MFLLSLIFAIIGAVAAVTFLKWLRKAIVLSKMPGPPPLHILKYIGLSLSDVFKEFRRITIKYRPIHRYWAGIFPTVLISDPRDVECIISGTKNMSKSPLYELLHPWLGTGLLTSTGSKWQQRRKILTPAFHFNILQQFIPVFTKQTQVLVEQFKELSEKEPTINVVPHITQFTLHSICETAMGTSLDESDEQKKYKEGIYQIGELTVHRLLRPWLYFNSVFLFTMKFWEQWKMLKMLHSFTINVIKERRTYSESILSGSANGKVQDGTKKRRLAMLDLLLSAGSNTINDEGIREEVDTFMFEGHDTTSTSICFTLMLLANHKDIQEKVRQEVEEILGGNKEITFGDLQELRYLEMCIKESLRLYPSVHFIARMSDEDIKTPTGYMIPKETPININIYDLHHNPDIYPDPEKFDPDRFLLENCKDRHPFAYIPFSAGPRNCIGQRFAMLEMKTVIAGVVKNFNLEPIDKPSDVNLIADLILRPESGLRIKFSPR